MTLEGLIRRLLAGRAVNHVYDRGELTGLVSAWKYQDAFILTWEECRKGDIHNEHLYTRDEREVFASAQDVLAYIEKNSLSAADFRP